jgi:hypothetical protein
MLCFAKERANRFALGIVLLVVFIFIGIASTLYISTWQSPFNTPTYEWYSILNIPWSIVESSKIPPGAMEAMALVTVLVIALNWLTLSRDLVVVKIAVPPRVKEARAEGKTLPQQEEEED